MREAAKKHCVIKLTGGVLFSVNYPRNLDYENPSSCDIVGGRNFNIEFDSKVDDCPIKLGLFNFKYLGYLLTYIPFFMWNT